MQGETLESVSHRSAQWSDFQFPFTHSCVKLVVSLRGPLSEPASRLGVGFQAYRRSGGLISFERQICEGHLWHRAHMKKVR